MRFRSRPQVVEAVQWTGDNLAEVLLFAPDHVAVMHGMEWSEPDEDGYSRAVDTGPNGDIELLAGVDGAQYYVPVPVGHWIVRRPDDHSDHWPVDPDYFADKYEPEQAWADRTSDAP